MSVYQVICTRSSDLFKKKLVSRWMLCARKRVTSTKIYVASHKSSPQKREIGISVTSEVQFPRGGARFSFQEIVAVRGEWCSFLYFPWNLIVRVPLFFFFFFTHCMLIHRKLLRVFPFLFFIQIFLECDPRRKCINFPKMFSRER